jgi:VIT1/CCC1 family predicted Fe2+/Mn2+ transporter
MSLEQDSTIQPSSTENQAHTDEEVALEQTPKTVKGQIAELVHAATSKDDQSRQFLLRVVQPGLAGLMDGSVSTLAPIFATAFAFKQPFGVFLVGMASATGAGISMAFSEALSDDGELTGRGSPVVRGGITGLMTFFGGALHTLPFLIANIRIALLVAYIVVAFELVIIAAIRHRYFKTSWWLSIVQVVGGGALVFAAALIFGNA